MTDVAMEGPDRIAIVSGGCGYVGRFLVEELLDAGFTVRALGRTPPVQGFFSSHVEFYGYDLDRETVPQTAFSGAYCFIHAAFDHVPGKYRGGEGEDPEAFRRRNLAGSVALFEAARRAGVGRTIFLSSRAAYGTPAPGASLDESDEALPDTLYGVIKLAAENALHDLSEASFQTCSLRVTGVYGSSAPGCPHKWTTLFSDYLAGSKVEPRAGTEVHGQDVAQAVRLLLMRADPMPRLLNVSDIVLDRHHLLSIVKRLTGSIHPLPDQSDLNTLNVMQTGRLRALGWVSGGMPLLERTIAKLLRANGKLVAKLKK